MRALQVPAAAAVIVTEILFVTPSREAHAIADHLRVLLWNTERGSNPYGPEGKTRVERVIRESGADVVLWQESYALEGEGMTLAQWVAPRLAMTAWQGESPHLAIASRYEFVDQFEHHPWHGIGARLRDGEGREFVVWSTWIDHKAYLPHHAVREPEASAASLIADETERSERYAQTQQLLWDLDARGHFALDVPLLVGGDWNCPSHLDWTEAARAKFPHRRALALPVSRLMQGAEFIDAFRFVHADPAVVDGATWSPLIETIEGGDQPDPPERIDRLYVRQSTRQRASLRPVAAQTLPVDWNDASLPRETSLFPSDHAAVLVDFIWTDGAPDEGLSAVDDGQAPGAGLDHRPLAAVDPSFVVSRFAFGSCYENAHPCPALEEVASMAPQFYLALGDNIYGDTQDMDELRQKYRQLARQPEWRLLARAAPVLAIWDDHDYGENDAGREYAQKDASRRIFLDFFSERDDSPRRQREDLRASWILGPPGRRVQIIVLDLRTRRSPLRSGAKIYDNMGSYEAHGESDDQVMLGDVQWKWLETELRRPADLRFIGLSTQLGVGFNGYEAWANFPREKERFFALLRKTGAEGVVLLSGDTHWGEINVRDDPDFYPVFDVTSSGVNQNWSAPGASDCRIGPPLNEPNVGFVEIDWSRPDPRVDVRLIDQTGAVRRALTMQRSELSIGAPSIDRASLLAKAMEGSWESAFGAIEFRRDGERVVAQYPGGSCDLRIEGGRLVGAWREGERTGLCSFTPVRCGRFLLGAYGRGEGPVLLAWPCWRAGAIETHDPPTRHSP